MELQQVGYLILWEYEVRPGLEAQFEKIYGSSGDWACLFSSSSMYYGTYLHSDSKHPRRYSTHDLWASASAFEEFRDQHATEYAVLDRECEKLTLWEKQIGRFERSAGT
jgi:hypothetical protein